MMSSSHDAGAYQAGSSGFSLIELLIVASVSAILLGGVIFQLRSNQDTQRLKDGAQTLLNDLRYAQAAAIAGNIPSGCVDWEGVRVSFTSTTEYEIVSSCDNGLAKSLRTNRLPSGIALLTPPASILFLPLTGRPDTGTTLGVVSLADTGNSYGIAVDASGTMHDVGFP